MKINKSKLTELLRYAWLEGRTNGLQNNGKSFSQFLELKEVSEAINYSTLKSDSELLLAFLKNYNNGEVTEYGINEVDDFLKHNS